MNTFEAFSDLDPALLERAQEVQERWSTVTADDITRQMPTPQTTEIYSGRYVKHAVVEPLGTNDIDHKNPIGLYLPYLNGWTKHHYIRAKVMQEIVAPEKPVHVFPNNSTEGKVYSLPECELEDLKKGYLDPIAYQLMGVLERSDIESAKLTGYSQGGLMALTVADVGSDRIQITGLNADEAPSARARTAKQLTKDFNSASGGFFGLVNAIKDAEIPALTAIRWRVMAGVPGFLLKSVTKEGKALKEAMRGDADHLVESAVRSLGSGAIKLGYVQGSSLFSPESIDTQVDIREYALPYKHASGDNVIAHALMVGDGLYRTNC